MLRICLYIAAALIVGRFFLSYLVFHPTKGLTLTPKNMGLAFEDVRLTTEDGVDIHGWYVPAENARATLLFFHGNAGNISHRLGSIEIFHSLGLSVFIVDYRGYGESGGRPTITGTAHDARAAWGWLTREKKTPPEKIVVFGRSLGGAIAIVDKRRASATETKQANLIGSPLQGKVAVIFDDDLRSLTTAASLAVRNCLASGTTPRAVYEPARCEPCSLIELCRPRAVSGARSARKWLAGMVED